LAVQQGPACSAAICAASVGSVFAALTVTAAIWVITAPPSPQAPTMDEFSQLTALGFIPG
jgi:hypothetical protein